MSTWIRSYTSRRGDEWVEDLGGVPWHSLPMPWWERRLLHWRHRPQTRGHIGGIRMIERCRCGATRLDGYGPWVRETGRYTRGLI